MADYSSLGLRVLPYTITSVEGGFAPRGRRGSGFPIGPIGTGRAAATAEVGTTVERDVGGEDREPRTPTTSTPSATPATSSLSGYVDAIKDYISDRAEAYFGFPEALNPLTGTVRATGVSEHVKAMMPGFFGPLMDLGYELNMANLTDIASKSQNKDYSVGLLNNQLVGVEPTADTIGGRIVNALGFNIDGYTLSGMIGSPPGIVSMSDYTDAITNALLSSTVTTYGPARSVAMGLSPQATYGLPDITSAVATELYGWDTSAGTGGILGGYGGAFSGVVTSIDPRTGLPTPVRAFNYETKTWSDTAKSPTFDVGLTARPGEFGYSGGQSAADLGRSKSGAGIGPGMGSTTGLGMETGRDPGTNSGGDGGGGMSDSGRSESDKGDPRGESGFSGGGRWAAGGRIEYAPGGNVTNGFINKDPDSVTEQESIADNRFTSVKEGSFIVNQPTNEKYEGMLDSLVAKAEKKVKKPKDAPMVDVALSDGERHIEPEVVAQIEKMKGKGFLDKLNNKGKPEVQRRQAKYGGGVGLNEGGIAEIDRGFISQVIGPDSPKISGTPTSQGSGFLDQPPPSIDDDLYFGRRFGDIKSAIQTVEIKGFEDNPYIFTGIKRKKAASSAFGPMQITASTLKDIKTRSKFYDMLGDEEKQYMDLLIQQGDDKINIEKYRAMYRDGKKVSTPDDIKKLYGRYGTGQIDPNLHEKHYDTIANITLMQKLQDHDSLQKALASYGEGPNYATKVLRALK